MSTDLNKLSLGTTLGIKDNEILTIKKNIKKLEEDFKQKQRKLKTENNPYLEELIIQNNNILKDKIDNCKKKCDGLAKLISYLTRLSSTNILVDKLDEKHILNEYNLLKKEIDELTDLII